MRKLALRLLLVVVGLELGSLVGHRLTSDGWFSWSEYRRRREEILAAEHEDRFYAGHVAVPWNLKIHPYHGFGAPRGLDLVEAGSDPRLADPGVALVGVTGGSVSRNLVRSASEVLAHELEASPRFAGKHVEIVELGHVAWKEPQQLVALAYYFALGGRLDLLVNLDGHNEIVDAAVARQRGLFPAYPTLWGALTRNALSQEEARRIGRTVFWRDARRAVAATFDSIWVWPSVTANVVWDVFDHALARRVVSADPVGGEAERGPRRTFATEKAFLQFCARVWSDSSIRMRDLAEASGAAYFHFLQPNQYVDGSKVLTEEERLRAYDRRGSSVSRGYLRLVEEAPRLEAAGVRFESLTDVFRDVHETIYVDPCCHVNPRGNEILARAIARAVLAADATASASP